MNLAVHRINTMSSVEIAELTGKRHNNVMADIRHMLSGIDSSADFSAVYKDQQLIDRPCFLLPKRETLILVSGYSVTMRAKIIDRWQTLEEAAKTFIPQTLPDALRLAADLADQVNVAQAALLVAAPKADALDRLATADGMVNLQVAGKLLQQKPNKFIQWLRENGWIYKRAGSAHNVARAEKFCAGYLTMKTCTVLMEDGTERVREQVMVTAKGLAKLAIIFGVQLQGSLI